MVLCCNIYLIVHGKLNQSPILLAIGYSTVVVVSLCEPLTFTKISDSLLRNSEKAEMYCLLKVGLTIGLYCIFRS